MYKISSSDLYDELLDNTSSPSEPVSLDAEALAERIDRLTKENAAWSENFDRHCQALSAGEEGDMIHRRVLRMTGEQLITAQARRIRKLVSLQKSLEASKASWAGNETKTTLFSKVVEEKEGAESALVENRHKVRQQELLWANRDCHALLARGRGRAMPPIAGLSLEMQHHKGVIEKALEDYAGTDYYESLKKLQSCFDEALPILDQLVASARRKAEPGPGPLGGPPKTPSPPGVPAGKTLGSPKKPLIQDAKAPASPGAATLAPGAKRSAASKGLIACTALGLAVLFALIVVWRVAKRR